MARYIDADKLREYWLENGVNENVYNTNNVLDSIDYQTTANVEEVRHGEWIRDNEVSSGVYYNCSLCGNLAEKDSNGNYTVLTPYCSLCGAKMGGKRE